MFVIRACELQELSLTRHAYVMLEDESSEV